jgi:tyrosyl-tRNA synthetase
MDAKMRLAEEIVAGFHGPDSARKAADHFQRVFRDRLAPEQTEELRFKRQQGELVRQNYARVFEGQQSIFGAKKWSQVLAYLRQVESTAEAERIIKQGGLEIDGKIVKDPTLKLDPNLAATYELRIGKKKFLRIIVE